MNTKKAISRAALLLLFILSVVVFFTVKGGSQNYPGMSDGKLEVSDESFYGNELLLGGEWEFSFAELLDSEGFETKEQKSYYVLPDFWQRDWNDTSVATNGYGTYRAQILFESPKQTISLYLPWVFGAYEVFANGESVLSCGEVGTTAETEKADVRARSVVIPVDGDRLDLVIQVSGHISGISGLSRSLALGTDTAVMSYMMTQIVPDALFIGCFFIMGFYHLVLFLLRRKNKSTLGFSLLCFFAVIFHGTSSFGLIYYLIPEGLGFFAYDLYILSYQWMIALFSLFSYFLFGVKCGMGKKHLVAQMLCCAIITLIEIANTGEFMWLAFSLECLNFLTALLFAARIVYLIFRRKEKSRFLFTYGILYLLLAIMGGLLTDFGLSDGSLMLGSALFGAFVFIEAVMLAGVHVDALKENERMNLGLETLVTERTAELAEANERLRVAEQRRKTLLSGISHDLRTPITAIKGYLELMEHETEDNLVLKEYTQSAQVRADQLEKLISDLFLLTRLTEGSLPIRSEPIDISVDLPIFCSNHQAKAERKDLHLVLPELTSDIVISADRSFLQRILDNLLENALYHAHSKVEVGCTLSDEQVVITVTDDGAGISAEDFPYLFERFYKKRKDGAGLGLCIVKELTEALGGEVFVESTPYVRTEFSVKFKR